MPLHEGPAPATAAPEPSGDAEAIVRCAPSRPVATITSATAALAVRLDATRRTMRAWADCMALLGTAIGGASSEAVDHGPARPESVPRRLQKILRKREP